MFTSRQHIEISEGVAPPVRRESSLPAYVFGTHLQTGSVSVNTPDDFWVGGGDNDDDEMAELYVILQPYYIRINSLQNRYYRH